MTELPLWVQSGPVQQLLNLLVDRMDGAEQRGSGRVQSVGLGERTWPALYKATRESEKEDLWEHVKAMAAWGWLEVKPETALRLRSGYATSPRLVAADVVAVRTAVGRLERLKSAPERWRLAVNSGLEASTEVRSAVGEYCIEIPERTMAEVVERLNLLPGLAEKPLLLREVSSQLFWGMSKILDKRQSMVAAILGTDECPFPESPVQLQVFLPQGGYQGILFIENLMSFERAIRSRGQAFGALALVYASGFKGSAQRLRRPDGCSIFYSGRGVISQDVRDGFEAWLFGREARPAYFWGDLDWSGMRILAAMRSTFADLGAWEPGYRAMLEALCAGHGHPPEAADKAGQRPVASTGCSYADGALLRALSAEGRFVDQETIALWVTHQQEGSS